MKKAAKRGVDPALDAAVRELDALFKKKAAAVEKEDYKAAKEIKGEMETLQAKCGDLIKEAKAAFDKKF